MSADIIVFVLYLLFVVGWFIYWFGTYHGNRVLDGFSNLGLHLFAFFCGALVVALSLGFGYIVLTNFMSTSYVS